MPNPIMEQLTVGNTTWDIYDGRVGDLSDLTTTDKSSVVAAINEAAQGGGGGGSVSPYTSNPAALGTANPGSSANYSRGDHVHDMPSASDVGAIAVSQGVGNAGKFCVVGNDGNATFVTMSAWSAGSY